MSRWSAPERMGLDIPDARYRLLNDVRRYPQSGSMHGVAPGSLRIDACRPEHARRRRDNSNAGRGLVKEMRGCAPEGATGWTT